MDCLGQLCSIVPCLWECSRKHLAYIRHLEDNLNSLRTAMFELNNRREDVQDRVNEAVEQRKKPRNEVNGWLQMVVDVKNEVNPILVKGDQELENKCVGGCCPMNCCSSYNLGKKVTEKLTQVKDLREKGQFDVIADPLPPPPVDVLPMEGPVVGFESYIQNVWKSVQDKNPSIIGLVGSGGVGKTTLLKQLNNELSKDNLGFDLVFWIVVSQPADLRLIRDTIRKKLGISNHIWENGSEEVIISQIFEKLKDKKFVMLLDDVWERLDLSKVGISIPQCGAENMSKVVFTTRSQEVCQFMEAHEIINVGCLPHVEALKLFTSKLGEDVLNSHPQLQPLVEDVTRECAGLPLALITIGRAMRGKTDAQQWKDANRLLETYPEKFPGVKDEIFLKLVFSYDCLPISTYQKCFEYCTIFPEDHEILLDELIELWIAEGIIDEYGDMYDARFQGRQIIEYLTQACLLEKVATDWLRIWDERVKMHDVIRDTALWIVCERGENKNKFCVNVIVGDHAMSSANRWKNAERVSLWGNIEDATFKSFAGLSSFSNLVTLIIKNNSNLTKLPGELFQSMKVLKVLNLSYNELLRKLPAEIGGLADLEYLNIRATCVRRLPEEVRQLKKLRFLLVSGGTLVRGEVISSLESLQVFENSYGEDGDIDDDEAKAMDGEMLQGLEKLKHMMDLCIKIYSAASVQILLKSQNLQSRTRQLRLICEDESLPAIVDFSTSARFMKHLESLNMGDCKCSMIKFGSSLNSLREIEIRDCPKIQNLSSLVYLHNLCALTVSNCESMEELIGEDEMMKMKMEGSSGNNINLFPSLISLTLRDLPKLRSICPQSALSFPSLKRMIVFSCRELRKLPFDSSTANTTHSQLLILGDDRGWWDSVQWDTQETKDAFTPKFKELGPLQYLRVMMDIMDIN